MGSITIRVADGSAGYVCATSSGVNLTNATNPITVQVDSSNRTLTILHDNQDVAYVRWQRDTEGNAITNSPMLEIRWGSSVDGALQQVLFSSSISGKYLANWKTGTTSIGENYIVINSGSTIEVSSKEGSGQASNVSPSHVGIQGYYYAKNGRGGYYNYNNGTYTYNEPFEADTAQGTLDSPAYATNRQTTEVCFKYNGEATLFVFMLMRGWTGRGNNNPGTMGIISGSGPIVNSVFQSDWASGYDDAKYPYRMDVFAISGSGMYPSVANMITHRSGEQNNPAINDNSTWIKQPAESLNMAQVTYYDNSGTHILRTRTEARLNMDFTKPINSAINFYKDTDIYEYVTGTSGTKVIPDGYRFVGWYKKVGSGAETGPHTTQASLDKVTNINNISLRIYYEPIAVTVTYSADGGTPRATNNYNYNTTITINPNGGTHVSPNGQAKTSSYTYTLTGNITLQNPTRENYIFTGWSVSGTTYTAQWRANNASIVYKPNNGGIGGSDKTYEYQIGSTQIVIERPLDFVAPSKMRFIGWKINGQGSLYRSGLSYTVPEGGLIFQATWASMWRPCLVWIYNKQQQKWEKYMPYINDESYRP